MLDAVGCRGTVRLAGEVAVRTLDGESAVGVNGHKSLAHGYLSTAGWLGIASGVGFRVS